MHNATRASIALTIVSLALYVSGLQKKVLGPIADWLADLPTGLQLAGIVAVLVGVIAFAGVRSNNRRRELASAKAHLGERVPGPSALPAAGPVFTSPPPPPRFA